MVIRRSFFNTIETAKVNTPTKTNKMDAGGKMKIARKAKTP